tara:strand:+ start:3442 stop:4623 length:1182 start_codon:yes stop_codon:yes gene_type:complete
MQNKKSNYIMPTYGDRNIEFETGKGCYLYTKNGEKYLDFGAGIAVNSLGHCHPKLVDVLTHQAQKLWHTSNLYFNKDQEEYAELLCNNSFAEKVFFCNSGVEAIECGIKVVRSYHNKLNQNFKKNIITFEGAFHGRTFAAMSAQQDIKYYNGFEPLLSGFIKVPFNDLNFLKTTINENTAAILIEPIQGEGGIRPAKIDFLKNIKEICLKNNILLFFDEVQSGFGRSGKLFSYEWANIEPDIMAVAKGIGSGFPMGACMTTNKACIGMVKGTHGSTYGGNPLSVSIGKEVLKIIKDENFLQNVKNTSNYLWDCLKKLESKYSEIVEVRGAGLLLGIKTKNNNLLLSKALIKNKLLNVPASDNVIRLVPPLIISNQEVDKAIKIIEFTLKEIND